MFRTMPHTFLSIIFLSVLSGFWHAPLANPVQTEHVRAELGSVVGTIQPGASFWVVLHLRMQEGWHTYWQNPGDSGLATTIRWVLPEGFQASDILWPYPRRLPVGPLMNYGYEGEVVLLTQITVPPHLAPEQSVTFQAETSWVVCADICIPESASLSLQLPVRQEAPRQDARWQAKFTDAQAALPQPAPWPVAFAVAQTTLTLLIETPELVASPPGEATFFPLAYGMIDHAAPQHLHVTPQGLHLILQRGTFDLASLAHLDGVLVMQEKRDATFVVQAFTVRAVPTKSLR